LTEPQLNDIAMNFLRTQLVTVPGAAVPFPYGGKTRQVMVNINPNRLQAKGLSPSDVLTALESGVVPGRTEIMGFLKRNYNSSWIPRVLRKFVGPSDFRERNTLAYREA
jgi:multidrug efflux pump subunit AcrB